MKRSQRGILTAGSLAGIVNGLLGAGGGMVLVPLLSGLAKLDEEQIFPTSVAIILPISIVSLVVKGFRILILERHFPTWQAVL